MWLSCGIAFPMSFASDYDKKEFLDILSNVTFYMEDTSYVERIVPVHIVDIINDRRYPLFLIVERTNGERQPITTVDSLYGNPRPYWRKVVIAQLDRARKFMEESGDPNALVHNSEQD